MLSVSRVFEKGKTKKGIRINVINKACVVVIKSTNKGEKNKKKPKKRAPRFFASTRAKKNPN